MRRLHLVPHPRCIVRLGSRISAFTVLAGLMAFPAPEAFAAQTWYVDAATGSDANDGLTAETAFATIQKAVICSASNDVIRVDDGVYAPFWTSNKCIRIESVNGPETTIVDGGNSQRCAMLAMVSTIASLSLTFYSGKDTFVSGFSFRNGRADTSIGGGTVGGTISNCVYTANRAGRGGGAAYGNILNSSLFANATYGKDKSLDTGSLSGWGGGLDSCSISFCVVSNNVATRGGGLVSGTATNSLIVANTANYYGGTRSGVLFKCRIIQNVASEDIGGSSGVMENCWIEGNRAKCGGGVEGYATNCVLVGNMALDRGGAAFNSTLVNCTAYGNSASVSGGGAFGGKTINSIVCGNVASATNDICLSEASYSCTSDNCFGIGNIRGDPRFVNAEIADFRLLPESPCVNGGYTYANALATDMVGCRRVADGRIDMGAFETDLDGHVGIASIQPPAGCQIDPIGAKVEVGGSLTFTATGVRQFLAFYTNGVFASDNNTFTWDDIEEEGLIEARFDLASPVTFYVDANHGNDDWNGVVSDAPLASIQEAIRRCCDGDAIVVADGTYPPINVPDMDIRISSLNGKASTTIDGGRTNCCAIFASQRTVLAGFTLTNGYGTQGGGARKGTLEDCDLVGNTAANGGGAYGSRLKRCHINANTATAHGGGAYDCRLENCEVVGNSAQNDGGGMTRSGSEGSAANCLFANNHSRNWVVDAYLCINCTIVQNTTTGASVLNGSFRNCIIWGNSSVGSTAQPRLTGSCSKCCLDIPPKTESGTNLYKDYGTNIYADPVFADPENGNYRLDETSPCIDIGNTEKLVNLPIVYTSNKSTDLDGNARFVGPDIDIGCYEYPIAREVPVVKPTFTEIWGEWSSETAPSLAMPAFVASWDDFARVAWDVRDAFIRSGTRMEVPPSEAPVVISLGAVAVPLSMIPESGDGLKTETEHDTSVWRLHMRENADSGTLMATIGGLEFSIADLPSYLSDAWTSAVYGEPPFWLSDEELAKWQAARRRDRIEWFATLVKDSDWATYAANREDAADAVLADDDAPALQFAAISTDSGGDGVHALTLRSTSTGNLRLFGTTNLTSGIWNYEGFSVQPRGNATAGAVAANDTHFFMATAGDRDSDGDGIPDAVETLVLGTNPRRQATSGGGLTDWDRIYRYDLDPFVKDSSGDGISDAEIIARGADPRIAVSVQERASASRSIRYTYDDDDRLTTTWFGLGGGAVRTTLTPAGNPTSVGNDTGEE